MRKEIILVTLVFLFLSACRPEEYVPKPRAYARIDTPAEHTYQVFDKTDFPYAFEYPTYAKITKDTSVFHKTIDNPYWINIDFPELNGTIYLSYKRITGQQTLANLLEDAHFMSYYHTKRADGLQSDLGFRNKFGVQGFLYEWLGDAASKYQFVATDSVQHFVRGALYFNCTPNADSLKPYNDFLKKDIKHLLETMHWK